MSELETKTGIDIHAKIEAGFRPSDLNKRWVSLDSLKARDAQLRKLLKQVLERMNPLHVRTFNYASEIDIKRALKLLV
jgi:hypothetical protein